MKLMIPASLAALLLVAGHADAASHAPQPSKAANCKPGSAQHCQSHAKRTGTHGKRKAGTHHASTGKNHAQLHAKAPASDASVPPTE